MGGGRQELLGGRPARRGGTWHACLDPAGCVRALALGNDERWRSNTRATPVTVAGVVAASVVERDRAPGRVRRYCRGRFQHDGPPSCHQGSEGGGRDERNGAAERSG